LKRAKKYKTIMEIKMQNTPKLTQVAKSIKLSKKLWQEKIRQSWELGREEGTGFAIGDIFDSASTALAKEGYELIAEINGISVGTDWLTSIVAVMDCYGPWAVDITDNLLSSNYSVPQRLSLFSRIG
jgi:hypothetical protein